MALLAKIYDLEVKIDQFLNLTTECAIILEQFVRYYLDEKYADCALKTAQVRANEQKADDLRTQTVQYVYSHTLIPENRGDVLAILEGTDECIDQIKEIIIDMWIEKPSIPLEFHKDFMSLTMASASSLNEMVRAMRAFFYNIHEVSESVHKVIYYEKEADDIAERIKTLLYQSEYKLAQKNHCKYFVRAIEKISDYAQNVADRLTIYTLKRKL